MKTRTIVAILVVCGCLAAADLGAYAADEKTTADAKTTAAAPAKTASAAEGQQESDKLKEIDELISLGPKAADKVKFLEDRLKDPSPKVRAHAALALGAIGPAAKDSASALAELIRDPDTAVRRAGLHAIQKIHPGPQIMVPILVKLMEDSDPTIQGRILSAIAECGKDAVPGLIAALKNEKATYSALVVLRDIGPDAKDAVPAIIETLQTDKRPEIHREAALTLGAMGDAARAALPELAKLLKDEHAAAAATFVMGELSEIPKDAEATVRENAKSDDKMLSTTSLWALARVHPNDKDLRREVGEKLVAGLKDNDPFVRAGSARALAALPPDPDIMAPIFEKALKDADETAVHHALDALAMLGERAVPRLIDALKYEKFRPDVIYVLGRIGPAAAPATSSLAKYVEDKNSRVAHEAIIALGDIGPAAKDAVPALAKALGQAEDRDMNFAAIAFALGKIGPAAAAAEAPLLDKLNNKSDDVRLMSAWALAQIAGSSTDVAAKAVPVLVAGLSMNDAEDKVLAAEALGAFGPLAKDAEEPLKKAAGDADKNVAEAAAASLKTVQAAAPTTVIKPADVYKPGDQVVTVLESVEIGVAGKQGQVVAKGTKLKVLEVRGSWIGVRGEADGKTYSGWLLADQIGRP